MAIPLLLISNTVKIFAFALISLVCAHFFRNWKKTNSIIPRNLSIAFIAYALAPMASLGNTLFNWKNFIVANSNFGMSLAFVLGGVGNIIYFWFVTTMFSDNTPEITQVIQLWVVSLAQLVPSTIALVLRLNGLSPIVSPIVYMLSSLYIFTMLALKTNKLFRQLDPQSDGKVREKLLNISISSLILLIVMILFSIDSFYDDVTWFAVIGWAFTAVSAYFIKRSQS